MPDQSNVKIRFGDPGLAALSVVVAAVVALSLCILLTGATMNTTVPGAFRVFFGLLATIALVGVLGFGLFLARNPRLISRTILVTPVGVLLPARRFGLIPIAEIAGVGLALQRSRNGLPGGQWAVAVWRRDRSLAYVGGFQRRAQLADPSGSRVAQAAHHLYEVVLNRQGLAGPLSRLQLQRHASFGPFESFTASWDPSASR